MHDQELVGKISKNVQQLSHKLVEHGISNYSAFGIWALTAYASLALAEKDVPKDAQEIIGLNRDELTFSLSRLDQALPQEVSFALASWVDSDKNSKYLSNLQVLSENFATNHQHRPKQDEADAWIKEKSFNIFEEFPTNVEQGDVWGMLASLIAMDIKWNTKFEVRKFRAMSETWGVEKVLFDTETKIHFFTCDNETYLAVHAKLDADTKNIIVSYTYVSPNEYSKEDLQREILNYETNRDSYTSISMENAYKLNSEPFIPSLENATMLPAWDMSTSFKVDEIIPALGSIYSLILDKGDYPETTQAVKASYNAEGFKAAAVTYSMFRSASVSPKNTYYFSFSNPFIVKSFAYVGDKSLCLFEFLVTKENAVEAFLTQE